MFLIEINIKEGFVQISNIRVCVSENGFLEKERLCREKRLSKTIKSGQVEFIVQMLIFDSRKGILEGVRLIYIYGIRSEKWGFVFGIVVFDRLKYGDFCEIRLVQR